MQFLPRLGTRQVQSHGVLAVLSLVYPVFEGEEPIVLAKQHLEMSVQFVYYLKCVHQPSACLLILIRGMIFHLHVHIMPINVHVLLTDVSWW